MAKRKFILQASQEQELLMAFQQSKHGPTRSRYQAVRLYGKGYEVCEILDITGCSRSSLMEWCHRFLAQGAEGLQDQRRGGNRAKLSPVQLRDLSERLHQYTPAQVLGPHASSPSGLFWTVEDLQRVLEAWYEVSYSGRPSYTTLLARCGFSYQRPAKVYKSRQEHKVMDFEEQLEKK
jgi:transposase